MPNWCYFQMAVGGRYDCVYKFVEYISNNYKNPHFARVDVIGFTVVHSEKHRLYKKVYIEGECAWSVNACFFDDIYTYYNQYKTALANPDESNAYLRDPKVGPLLSILQVAKDLRLNIEIYSTEPGMCFCEYYYIEDGNLVRSECGNYREFYCNDYNTYEEFCKDYNFKYPDDGSNDVDEDEFYDVKEYGDTGLVVRSDYGFEDIINDTAKNYDKSKNVEMCHITKPMDDIDTILSKFIKK